MADSNVAAETCVALGATEHQFESFPGRDIALGALTVTRVLPVEGKRLSRLSFSTPICSRHHVIAERIYAGLFRTIGIVNHHCAGTGVRFCHTDAAIVVSSSTPMTATDTPALTGTHSLASIFAAVNARSAAMPVRR